MVIHKHLLRAAAIVYMAASLYGCALEPYELPEEELFTRAFIKEFGLIDPDQDWNIAEKKDVTVNVEGGTARSLKVYADINGKYYLVADYINVKGKVTIPFDVLPTTEDLRVVVDGKEYRTKAAQTVEATVKARSRTTMSTSGKTLTGVVNGSPRSLTVTTSETDDYEVFNSMQMTPIVSYGEWADYISLNGNVWRYNNPDGNYLTPAAAGAHKENGLIPEGTSDNNGQHLYVDGVGNTQNPGITQNFKITPKDGKFTIYPMYWRTDLRHELGIYLIDDNGNPVKDATGKILRYPIYQDKEGDNLQVYVKGSNPSYAITIKRNGSVTNNITMHAGESVTLIAETSGGTTIRDWYQNRYQIATAHKNASNPNEAVVKAHQPGAAAIGVTNSAGVVANCDVLVLPSYMEMVESAVTMASGQTTTLSLRYPYDNSLQGQAKTWTSSNTGVATVDADGTITAHNPGTTTITVSCQGTVSTCTVTVTGTLAQRIKIGLSSNLAPAFVREQYYDEVNGVWSATAVNPNDGVTYTLPEAIEYSLGYSAENRKAWFDNLGDARGDYQWTIKHITGYDGDYAIASNGYLDIDKYTYVTLMPDWGGATDWEDTDDDGYVDSYLSADKTSWNNIALILELIETNPAPVRRTIRPVATFDAADEAPQSRALELPDALKEEGGTWVSVTNSNMSYDAYTPQLCRSKGINIDLGDWDGDVGMYIRHYDGPYGLEGNANAQNLIEDSKIIYYSQADLNTHYNANYTNSYACSFRHPVSGRLFFSFEDWANVWNQSDMDLNDLVFLMKDVKEVTGDGDDITKDEDPYQWLIAVEDLGSTDDFDFNDLVIGISSVSTNYADNAYPTVTDPSNPSSTNYSRVTITALAAGGVLKAWLYYRNTRLEPDGVADSGEWHKWFGNNISNNVMLNTGRRDATPKSYIWNIQNFSMPAIWKEDPSNYVNSNSTHNFKVAVTTWDNTTVENTDKVDQYEVIDGNKVRFVVNGGSGNAPQMFLVPGEWKWPSERAHIGLAYDRFRLWVKDSSNKDWWKYPALGADLYQRR